MDLLEMPRALRVGAFFLLVAGFAVCWGLYVAHRSLDDADFPLPLALPHALLQKPQRYPLHACVQALDVPQPRTPFQALRERAQRVEADVQVLQVPQLAHLAREVLQLVDLHLQAPQGGQARDLVGHRRDPVAREVEHPQPPQALQLLAREGVQPQVAQVQLRQVGERPERRGQRPGEAPIAPRPRARQVEDAQAGDAAEQAVLDLRGHEGPRELEPRAEPPPDRAPAPREAERREPGRRPPEGLGARSFAPFPFVLRRRRRRHRGRLPLPSHPREQGDDPSSGDVPAEGEVQLAELRGGDRGQDLVVHRPPLREVERPERRALPQGLEEPLLRQRAVPVRALDVQRAHVLSVQKRLEDLPLCQGGAVACHGAEDLVGDALRKAEDTGAEVLH
eukprot:CAMPEP_0114495636 /NCGR_PEP_ID=MMETSP0109-20121206/5321_1 /TAXON_ID=29199 /ORGANISM="Chlorarachnion reptans, Strain CCCM449" /LENGTH=392 /DNA_ID=CAMNT_0001672813 /DNA_START=129 /DNA_END=1306 /DNA_ORIENTATION=-